MDHATVRLESRALNRFTIQFEDRMPIRQPKNSGHSQDEDNKLMDVHFCSIVGAGFKIVAPVLPQTLSLPRPWRVPSKPFLHVPQGHSS